jgi:SAM-dependent methyltransferase
VGSGLGVRSRLAGNAAVALFGFATFAGASLLFLVQPMLGKVLLPRLGGVPAVWNTCLVFFQAVLLLGYLYAHASIRWLGVRRQAVLHLGLLLLGLALLPIRVPEPSLAAPAGNPVGELLYLLARWAGLPFFVVATTAPLVQRWFAATGHPRARDPYFLYAASNLGSLSALLAYPTLVEPIWPLTEQSTLWAAGYVGLAGLLGLCAGVVWWSPAEMAAPSSPTDRFHAAERRGAPPDSALRAQRARWVLLSFVPSSLLLSVTTYLTTDIAAMPLLWVLPLGVYLLTFVLAFARTPLIPRRVVGMALPVAILIPFLSYVVRLPAPAGLFIPVHLAGFFVAALLCHGELAAARPSVDRLTEFYLWVAFGGVLGGLVNAFLAPTLFTVPVEYPLGLVLACFLRPSLADPAPPRRTARDLMVAAALGGLIPALPPLARAVGVAPGSMAGLALTYGLPLLLCSLAWSRPARFALGLAAILLAGSVWNDTDERTLFRTRSFFGVHQVLRDPDSRLHYYMHGSTLHGVQSTDPARRHEALSYFRRPGPIGQLFERVVSSRDHVRVAVVGLGVGTLAAYAAPTQHWTFYEIDPAVERIARDPRLFTYIADCAAPVAILIGDARVSLARAETGAYDVIVLDAFSSDAIPVHLLTREALQLYLTKLAPGGVLAFNVTNRHVRLEPMLGALARAEGLESLVQEDWVSDPADRGDPGRGVFPSAWVVMARRPEHLGPLTGDPRWGRPTGSDHPVWTDDFSSLLPVLTWSLGRRSARVLTGDDAATSDRT